MPSRNARSRNDRARKRQKVDHDPDATMEGTTINEPVHTTAEAVATQPVAVLPVDAPQHTDCEHKKELVALDKDLDSMRQLITCKICQHLLTEPYCLGCGHTYCYICLDTWLVAQKKSTCPECRTIVKQEPTPSYIVREMVVIFSQNPRLRPEGETLEDLQLSAQESAAKVANDKAESDGQLFKGIFKDWAGRGGLREAIFDEDDHVHRCPVCFHEVEDGRCTGCGEPMAGMGAWSDDNDVEFEDNEDLDHDLSQFDDNYIDIFGESLYPGPGERVLNDEEAEEHRRRHHRNIVRALREHRRAHTRRNRGASDESSSSEETTSEMDSFIDDGEEEEVEGPASDSEESHMSEAVADTAHHSNRQRGIRVLRTLLADRHRRGRAVASATAHRPIVLSDSDDDDDDDEIDSELQIIAEQAAQHADQQQWGLASRPVQGETTDEEIERLLAERQHNLIHPDSDSDDVSSEEDSNADDEPVFTGRQTRSTRIRPIVLDDDDDDDDGDDDDDVHGHGLGSIAAIELEHMPEDSNSESEAEEMSYFDAL